MSLSSQRVRLHVNCTSKKIGVDVLTAATPHILKPSHLQFEIGLFDDDVQDIKSLAGLDQLVLTIKAQDPRTGLAVMQKTLAIADMNPLMTVEQWETGLTEHCHALFEFTDLESNVELDDDQVDFYIVIHALSDDASAKQIPLANGTLIIEESGAFVDPPASVVEDQFYTKAQSDSRYLLSADLTGKINKAGDTMTGLLTLSGAPTSNLHASTKKYVDDRETAIRAATLALTGGTLSGLLTLSGAPTSGLHAATKTYVDTADALRLALTGGTLTGLLTLSGAPTSGLHAATKTYADLKLALAGGTMTGVLTLSGAPTSNLHAATKLYVDTAVANLVNSAPGTLDTLKELSDALGADANFSTTITTALATKLALAGGTMTGALTLSGAPTSGLHAATKTYADTMLPLAGGTMTGVLTLSGAPTSNLHAATKLYVDTADALKLSLTGGTLSGALQFSGTAHLGLRVNNLTNSQAAAVSINNGFIYYDTTMSKLVAIEGNTRKNVISDSTGTTWLAGSGSPGGGTGADGDYYLDEDNGEIHRKASGSWSLIVAARVQLGGDVMSGTLSLSSGDVDIQVGALRIGGNQVVGARQANVADTSGASLGSLETSVNSVKAVLRTHGLM